jgi:cytochrome c
MAMWLGLVVNHRPWEKVFHEVYRRTTVIVMKKWNAIIVVILLLNAAIFVAQLALAKEESRGLANESLITSSNKTELVSFVESAVTYAQKNGKDKALKEFSNKTGTFVRGDLYIYAYDFNGTNIAHPFKPDWIGKNKLNLTDSNGVPFIRNLINVAKEGKGFTYFIFQNPAHGNRDEFKIAYTRKVDENWWLGSGIYLSCL